MSLVPHLPYDVADLGLAEQGRRRVEHAERSMPVLGRLRARFAAERPLAGLTVAACAHVTPETAALARTLTAGGAVLHVAASNPLSTQDDVAAALVAVDGVGVQARHGVDRAGYAAHLRAVLDGRPALLLDDGCDLVQVLHAERPELLGGVRAAGEQTSTGVLRLRQMHADGALRLPVVAVNDTPMQLLVANRHGTGQSTLDAVMRATGALLAGTVVVVAGYGWCGSGVAAGPRGSARRSSSRRSSRACARGRCSTATGCCRWPRRRRSATSSSRRPATATCSPPSTSPSCRTGRCSPTPATSTSRSTSSASPRRRRGPPAGSGRRSTRTSCRTAAPAARRRGAAWSTSPRGRAPAVGHGHLLRRAGAHRRVARRAELAPGVHEVPAAIDDEVARTKLASLGVRLDVLTAAQERYLSSWQA
jgi:adenosylhomocysteinase